MRSRPLLHGLILCSGLSIASYASADIWHSWIDGQAAGKSTSDREARLLPQKLVEPTPAIAPQKARFWGYWHGWFGNRKDTDMKVVVSRITPTDEFLVQYSYSNGSTQWRHVYTGKISGNEVIGTLPSGAVVHLRLRPNADEMEVLVRQPNQADAEARNTYGLLQRQAIPANMTVGEDKSGWPELVSNFKPAPSLSPVKSEFPQNLSVKQPPANLSPEKIRWSGKWSGWACNQEACDTRLAVEAVSDDGAEVVYAFAAQDTAPFHQRVRAKFVGNELQGTLRSGATIRYRMRAADEVEFLLKMKNGSFRSGLLTREPTR